MKKILVVDDERAVRDLLREKLEKDKYAVITAASGQEALAACKTDKPDLVLLDIAMPAMDGYQTCERLKEDPLTEDIPILFLTGQDLDPQSIVERYKELGACGYLSKVSTLKELLEKIKKVIG
jgi:CheY-like chemotaxis protein